MTNREYIKEMFALQQKLNDETNGIDWENGYTKNNRIINWKRCIYMESAELIDSFNWKHWKDLDKAIDWENATVELVDIWHFIMSLVLEDYKTNHRGDLDQLVSDVLDVHGFEQFSKEASDRENAEFMEIINEVESLIHETTKMQVDVFDRLLKEYFALALKCGVNLHVLYKFYVAKNILNKFRQDHGYKEGTYKKVWGQKEDNEVMIELLESGSLGANLLYAQLEKIYQKA
ncbi:MAG: dUTP diphosphatase [Sulfurospirillum sp.]|nr:dUTP diphosphatase [Sulfurospirillum sp.]